MRKTNEEIEAIYLIAKNQIQKLGKKRESELDREIWYELLNTEVDMLLKEYEKAIRPKRKNFIRNIIIKLHKNIIDYIQFVDKDDIRFDELYQKTFKVIFY